LVATIRPIAPGDSSSFIIHDNSSEIAKFIPDKYVEPLVIVARILGFDGIDDYIIYLIKDRLAIYAVTSRRDNNLHDSFKEYIHDMMIDRDVPKVWTPNHSTNPVAEKEDGTTTPNITAEEDDTNEEKDSK
jgi:hypothetical protein